MRMLIVDPQGKMWSKVRKYLHNDSSLLNMSGFRYIRIASGSANSAVPKSSIARENSWRLLGSL